MKEISIIIPTFNEKENIRRLIKNIKKVVPKAYIVIVDDSIDDEIGKIVKKNKYLNVNYYHRKNAKGRGSAVLFGLRKNFSKDKKRIFIEMDADFSHDPKDLPRLYEACHKNNGDLAIGSRYVKGVNIVNWPMSRLLMSFFASKYVKTITGMPIHDSTAGFKCYKRKVLEKINLDKIEFIGYAFQIEMKFKSWKYGFNIVEVPVIFTDRQEGNSKMSGGIFYEALFGVIKMKLKSFFKNWS